MSESIKQVRLVDVAARAGVSRVAVGKVLLDSGSDRIKVAPDTAARIRSIAKEMGYRPNRAAQQLRGKPSNLIGVVIYRYAPSIEMDRLMMLEREAHKRDYQITVRVLGDPGDPGEMMNCLQLFESQGADGLIFLTGERCACTTESLERFKVCLYSGCAAVLEGLPGVVIDVGEGVRLSTEHLLAGGRRRIGLVGLGGSPYDELRRSVMAHAIAKEPGAEFLVWTLDVMAAKEPMRKLTPALADDIVRNFIVMNDLDGLVTINDYWAGALLKALRRATVAIPQQVAVVGYNNLELCDFTEPGLTTVEEHNDQIARACLDLFTADPNDENALPRRRVQPSLVKRGSTESVPVEKGVATA